MTELRHIVFLMLICSAYQLSAQTRYDTTGQTIVSGLRGGILRTTADGTGMMFVDTCLTCFGGLQLPDTATHHSDYLRGDLSWQTLSSSVAAPATTGTMSIASTVAISSVVGIVPTGNCTFNAPSGIAGQIMVFSITTSGGSSYNLNWNTNYKSTGTLATGTSLGKVFTVTFVCGDGTVWHEIGRTGAM